MKVECCALYLSYVWVKMTSHDDSSQRRSMRERQGGQREWSGRLHTSLSDVATDMLDLPATDKRPPLPPHHHCPLLCPFPHSTTGSLLPSFLPASRTVLSAQTVAVFINSWPCRMDRCPEKQLIQKAYSKFV